jgi:hypothetical protein
MPAQGLVDLRPSVSAVEGHAAEGEHRRAFVAEILVEPMRHALVERLDDANLISPTGRSRSSTEPGASGAL